MKTTSRDIASRPSRRRVNGLHRTLASLPLLWLGACDNMKDQPSSRALDPSSHFGDHRSDRPIPRHAVARGEPPPNDPFTTGLRNGVPLERNPRPYTRDMLERGRERFNIYCAVCHGEDGYGAGIVVRRGFPPPPSFHDNRLRGVPDGQVFDAITRGFGVMPSYADRISPPDRWAIVAYVRALQRSQHATPGDVPGEAERTLLPP